MPIFSIFNGDWNGKLVISNVNHNIQVWLEKILSHNVKSLPMILGDPRPVIDIKSGIEVPIVVKKFWTAEVEVYLFI